MAAMRASVTAGSGAMQAQQTRVALKPFSRVHRQSVVAKAALSDSKIAQKAASLGAAASLLAAGAAHADESVVAAAQQVNEAADQIVQATGDNRLALMLGMLVPALGWVGYNILEPALNQYKNMQTRSVAAGLGLSAAALLLAQQAEAANEVSELAAGDNRLLILTVIFVPALGWVAFNILGPALNQLANMSSQNNKPGRR